MDISEKHQKVIHALRNYGANHFQLTHAFANSLNLHTTDARALVEIVYSQDSGNIITPSQLAIKLSLSKPALSACLNRLEEMELIVRANHPTDRRIILINYNPKIYEFTEKFFLQISIKMNSVLEKYTPEQIDLIRNFLDEASDAIVP